MKRVKGFNFDTVEDKNIIDYIEKQGNQSRYIKDLVQADIKKNNEDSFAKRELQEWLSEMAKKGIEVDGQR